MENKELLFGEKNSVFGEEWKDRAKKEVGIVALQVL